MNKVRRWPETTSPSDQPPASKITSGSVRRTKGMPPSPEAILARESSGQTGEVVSGQRLSPKMSVFFMIMLTGLWLVPLAGAQTTDTFGGNRSSDYQPPTGNPQGNVSTNLQPNSSDLQSPFGQAGINQQNLPQTTSLQVQNNGQGPPPPPPAPEAKPSKLPIILVGLATVTAIIYILVKPDAKPALSSTDVTGSDSKPTKAVVSGPKTSKKNKSKTAPKKKKHRRSR